MDELLNSESWEGFGAAGDGEIQTLMKALEAQQGVTDVANLTGVGALQPQSLESTLALLTFQDKHLTLWKDVPKGNAASTLEEYSVQTGYGQEGGWVGQMETPLEADPTAKRKFSTVSYCRQLWKISDVAGMVQTIQDAEVWAKQAAALRNLRTINRTLYSGNRLMIPESVDGFESVIRGNGSADHVIDLRGALPSQQTFDNIAELLTANFGNPDGAGIYCSPGGINTMSQILKQNGGATVQRIIQGTVDQNGATSIGFGIKAVHTPFGTMIPKSDIFIASEYEGRTVPKRPNPSNPEQLIEGKTSVRAPDSPTIAVAVVAPTVTNSKWLNTGMRPAAATYNYRVAAGNRFGLSKASGTVTGQNAGANVLANGAIDVTITPAASGNFPATFYEIYSEQVAGSGDFRFVTRVPDSGAATTVFRDLNRYIPGTTKMFVLDLTSVGEMRSFMLKRLAPMHAKEYDRIGEYRWGSVNLYVAPTYYAPLKYTLIENVPVGVISKSNLIEV